MAYPGNENRASGGKEDSGAFKGQSGYGQWDDPYGSGGSYGGDPYWDPYASEEPEEEEEQSGDIQDVRESAGEMEYSPVTGGKNERATGDHTAQPPGSGAVRDIPPVVPVQTKKEKKAALEAEKTGADLPEKTAPAVQKKKKSSPVGKILLIVFLLLAAALAGGAGYLVGYRPDLVREWTQRLGISLPFLPGEDSGGTGGLGDQTTADPAQANASGDQTAMDPAQVNAADEQTAADQEQDDGSVMDGLFDIFGSEAEKEPEPTPEPTPTPVPTAVPTTAGLVDYASAPLDSSKRITVSSAVASSVIDQTEKNISNDSILMFDDDINTNWQEGVEGSGIGQSVTAYFQETSRVRFITLRIGNWKTNDYYYGNNRPRKLTLQLGNYRTQIEFPDSWEEFCVEITPPCEAASLRITIDDVYKGPNWDDTVITDIGLYRE